MTAPAIQTPKRRLNWMRMLRRGVITIASAMLVGWLMHTGLNALERRGGPAGFTRGMLQGAMMPATMPNLLLGKDTVIYSERNTGVSYKLGYTAGVNGCGLLFFGYFFWRLNRWRKKIQDFRKD
jgi:hypothetical protein